MRLWRRWPLQLYYVSSLPWRRLAMARWIAEARAPVMVLFYHRVADDAANEWTCTRREFARAIGWVKAHYDVVSLAEAQSRIASGVNPRPAVAITFDDGYAENMDYALPLLVRERVPCTYFVASAFVLEGRSFPHDLAIGRPMAPNTPEHLREIASWGIEIGAHTRRHVDLGSLRTVKELRDEIGGSAEDLAALVGQPIRHFAFPYGQFSNLSVGAFDAAREAGFAGVCSAYGGYNFPGDNAFHLQRIHGDRQFLRLKNWLTVDPRKLQQPRFEQAYPAAAY